MPPAPAASPFAGDAVIVEPRLPKRLPIVLRNAWDYLPRSWSIHLLHGGETNATSTLHGEPVLRPVFESGALRLRTIESFGETVSSGRRWYNEFLTRSTFWSAFTAPTLLLFEVDVAFCPDPNWPVDRFAGFTFVGAPWSAGTDALFPYWCRNLKACVGNSGLSLWRRDVMARLTKHPPQHYERNVTKYLHKPKGSATRRGGWSVRVFRAGNAGDINSSHVIGHIDVWMTMLLQTLEQTGEIAAPAVPNSVVASRFAVETMYSAQTPWVPVGVHKPHRYLSGPQLDALLERCPPARALANETASESVPSASQLDDDDLASIRQQLEAKVKKLSSELNAAREAMLEAQVKKLRKELKDAREAMVSARGQEMEMQRRLEEQF